jgi:ribosomal subunit interface protein
MNQTPQIIFRNLHPSPAIDTDIRRRMEKLERFCHEILSCRVAIECDSKHKSQGSLYRVRVDIAVPGNEIIANSPSSEQDVYLSIRDAFDAAARQLEEYVQRRRREVKTHSPQ